MSKTKPEIKLQGDFLIMPGMATAHSHAFQRALRGRTQRKPATTSSFWSWRELMYNLVTKLSPEQIYHISHFAFVELAMSGVTAVGEFHYVHHQPGGTPYDDRLTLADAVIRAAQDAGLRITLIRTAYFRGGHQQELTTAQRRFTDSTTEQVLQDMEALQQRYFDDDMVEIGLAVHSIRAVAIEAIRELADFAQKQDVPFHMHVAEQRRELEECRQEYQATPVTLLAEHGILSSNFVGIHGTHLAQDEIQALGESKSFVCLCRTTERDLGDGLPHTKDLFTAGARLCVGVDSHASSDAFEEIRAVELDERSRTEARTVVAEASDLVKIATQNGFAAIGMSGQWLGDKVFLNAEDPSVCGMSRDLLTDAVVFGAAPRALDKVKVNGSEIVSSGRHMHYEKALANYKRTIKELGFS